MLILILVPAVAALGWVLGYYRGIAVEMARQEWLQQLREERATRKASR